MATSKDKGKSEKPAEKKKAAGAASDGKLPNGDVARADDVAHSLFVKAGAVGVVCLLAAGVLGTFQEDAMKRFSHSYLTAYMWALTITLGGVFWLTLQHLVNARWSVGIRRLGELIAMTSPVLGVLALPIVVPVLMGNDTLYLWANHETVEKSHHLHHKAGYLNPTFFFIRFLFYFGFWTLLVRYFHKQSLEQDKSGAPEIIGRMRVAAGPGMIVFALAVTFCSIDLIMSLDPFWYSTIFGVYYFASCVLAINSSLVLAIVYLQKQGKLLKSFTVEHLHDLGKMMFAFTVFWTYIAFSQFMLIWYANLPEETLWFKERFKGGWGDLSWALLVLHFVVPFFYLLSRHVKRNPKTISIGAVWILAQIYLDMYWLVMPNLKTEDPPFALIDLFCWFGLAGIVVAAVAHLAKNKNLVPVKDPRLERSLAFENI